MEQLIEYYKAKFSRAQLAEMLEDAKNKLADPSVDGWRYTHAMNQVEAINAILG